MKTDTLYKILIILQMGFFLTNFIIFRMKNELLNTITTLTIIVGGVLLLKDNYQRKKIK